MKLVTLLVFMTLNLGYAATEAVPTKKVTDIIGRDPFRRLNTSRQIKTDKRSELEENPTDQFKMVGVSTGPENLRALVQGPNGKTYFVTEKMKIGIRNGVITKITPKQIFVREKATNFMGEEEVEDVVINMPEIGASL